MTTVALMTVVGHVALDSPRGAGMHNGLGVLEKLQRSGTAREESQCLQATKAYKESTGGTTRY